MLDTRYNLEVGHDGNSELEDAHLPLLMVGTGSAASPQNHETHVVGLEESTETGTRGRLGSFVLVAALDAVCHLNAVCAV